MYKDEDKRKELLVVVVVSDREVKQLKGDIAVCGITRACDPVASARLPSITSFALLSTPRCSFACLGLS
jgi:hypothetical protein